MAYQEHNRVVIRGAMPNAERWSTSYAFDRDQNLPHLTAQAELDAFVADDTNGGTWSAALNGLLAECNSGVTITDLAVQYVGVNGQLLAQASRSFSLSGGKTATSGVLPNQVALVVSLRTAQPGPRGRGRMFLPCNEIARDSGLATVPAGTRTSMNIAGYNFLNKGRLAAAAADPNGTPRVVVASSTGTSYRVTGLRTGSVLDTMRSRRDRQVESYTNIVFP